ncbi:MAG: site-specific integrase, partial [Lachnospiraceae bacterium]
MAGKNHTYHEKRETGYILQLRELLAGLPPYTRDYFRAIEQKSSAKTRISYAYDFQVFLRFLTEKNPALKDKAIRDITLGDLNNLTALDIEEYQEHLKYYESENGEQKNGANSIARKMSSLRSMFDYFFKKELLTKNVAMQVDMPKIHEKAIIHLEPDEVAIFLDSLESYEKELTGRKKDFFLKTKVRDIAI